MFTVYPILIQTELNWSKEKVSQISDKWSSVQRSIENTGPGSLVWIVRTLKISLTHFVIVKLILGRNRLVKTGACVFFFRITVFRFIFELMYKKRVATTLRIWTRTWLYYVHMFPSQNQCYQLPGKSVVTSFIVVWNGDASYRNSGFLSTEVTTQMTSDS